jgi:hypothetical protein
VIFLYRFDKHKTKNGIDFVLNEGIAEDMYPDLELLLRPLVRSMCTFLMDYKNYSKTDTIFSGTILDTNELEVTFSEGLGKYVGAYEKSMVFEQGKLIAEILAKVMDRRSKESSTTPITVQQVKGTAGKRTERMRTDRPLAATNRPKKKKHSKKGTSTFRGIGWLPTLAAELDTMAQATANQVRALEAGLDSPHVFDDQVINHSIQVHRKAIDRCTWNRKQLDRWLSQDLDPGRRLEVERLVEVNDRVLAGNERVLDLCSQIKQGTINRIMEEDDFDLAVGALTGKYKMPEFDPPPMATSLERVEAAQAIHEFVESVLAEGGGDDDIVNHPEMTNYARLLMGIRVSAQPEEIDSLVKMFSGFGYFAKLLENMIEMLQEFRGNPDSGAFHPPHKKDPVKNSPTAKGNTRSNVHRLLTPLAMNRQFIEDFISADAPCFAMGVVEEARRPLGCMALRTLEAIPAEVSSGGFSFGHSILGNSQFEVLHFIFEFYGFKKFNVLLNPNNPLVQSVLTMMIESGEYFFFALSPNNSATAFRSEIGQEALCGIEANIARIKGSKTSDSEYERAISDFLKNPEPPGTMLDWVCRDNMGYLDLSGDTVALNPSKR